jgi:RiboL-PSP-HEPN
MLVTSLQGTLDELSKLIDEVQRNGGDPEASWLARLLVVRSCGYLEQVVDEVSRELMQSRSGGPIRSFSQSWLPTHRNPRPERLVEWVNRFDVTWARELAEELDRDDERLHRELSFLVDRRNRIAHGLNEGIGVRKALDLRQVSTEVADWFILRFNPNR